MIQLVTGACLLGQHDGCSGYTHDHFLTASEQPCLCPCHYDRAVRFQPADFNDDDEEPRYDRAQPAGLQGALDARRLLLTLVLAALLYLALCALSSAASNAAAPILYP